MNRIPSKRACSFVLLAAFVMALLLAAPAAAAPTCFGKRATIVGTSRRDRLVGTPGNDVIVGRGNNDEILGRGGRDRICGGRGIDMIEGGRGADLADGGLGLDSVQGNRGRDRVYVRGNGAASGGPGNDVVIGIDALYGGGGDDRLIVIRPWRGQTRLEPGPGDDFINASRDPAGSFVSYEAIHSAITVDLSAGIATGEGTDTLVGVARVFGTSFADHMTGSAEADGLYGARGDDYLSGQGGDDTLVGGSGDDEVEMGPGDDHGFDWGTGVDQHAGGAGSDTLHLDNGYGEPGVHVDLRIGEAVTAAGVERFDGIENIEGSQSADVLIGDDGPNRLYGYVGGPDRIEGHGGNDVLEGSGDADRIEGGDGDDVLGGGSTSYATYDGGAGNDTVACSYTHDCNGGPGFDFIDYRFDGRVEVDLATGDGARAGTVIAFEGVYGSILRDNILRGDAGPNILIGGPKNDRIFGAAGDDVLRGKERDDLLNGGAGVDSGDGGPGTDSCVAIENRTRCE